MIRVVIISAKCVARSYHLTISPVASSAVAVLRLKIVSHIVQGWEGCDPVDGLGPLIPSRSFVAAAATQGREGQGQGQQQGQGQGKEKVQRQGQGPERGQSEGFERGQGLGLGHGRSERPERGQGEGLGPGQRQGLGQSKEVGQVQEQGEGRGVRAVRAAVHALRMTLSYLYLDATELHVHGGFQ